MRPIELTKVAQIIGLFQINFFEAPTLGESKRVLKGTIRTQPYRNLPKIKLIHNAQSFTYALMYVCKSLWCLISRHAVELLHPEYFGPTESRVNPRFAEPSGEMRVYIDRKFRLMRRYSRDVLRFAKDMQNSARTLSILENPFKI